MRNSLLFMSVFVFYFVFSTHSLGGMAEKTPLVCPVSDKTPEQVSISHDIDAPYVDLNRELKDVGTEFVVKELFTTETTLFDYMEIIIKTMNQSIKSYREYHGLDDDAIYLIFKGGNVLRIVANQVFSMLPTPAKDLLETTYAENFKRSDTDFSIIVNPDKLNNLDYENTMNELLELSFNAFVSIRNELTNNIKKYFNFFRLNASLSHKIMEQYFDKIKHLSMLSDKDNDKWYHAKFLQMQLLKDRARKEPSCRYEGQFDYRFDFDKDKNVVGTPLSKKAHWLAISLNKTLEWPVQGMPDKIVKFYLSRLKAQFEYTYYLGDGKLQRKPSSGEAIDISFPHRDDFRFAQFIEHQDQWLSYYRLRLGNSDRNLEFKAESREGLVQDLYEVVFEQFSHPWLAGKYEKRINRLFFLSAAEMMGSWGLGSEQGKNYIEEIRSKILEPLLALYPLQGDQSKTAVAAIIEDAKNLKDTYEVMTTANKVWLGLAEFAERELIAKPQDNDQEEFRSLLKIIEKNLDVLWQLCDMEPMIIDLNKIYDASMKSFF